MENQTIIFEFKLLKFLAGRFGAGRMTKTRSLEKIRADFRARGSKMEENALFDQKLPSKSLKKHWYNNVLELAKKLNKIPYKTCRLLILLMPFSEKGPQKY